MSTHPTVGFVGGTGRLGRGLALRLSAAGYPVLIGSRTIDRALAAAAKTRDRLLRGGRIKSGAIAALANVAAVARADVVFLTLPFEGLDAFLRDARDRLGDKIVVDVVNPLRLAGDRVELISLPEGGVGACVQRLLPGARVVSAFKNIAAAHLLALERTIEGDALIAGDDAAAKDCVAALARAIPELRPIDAGALANGALLEAVTALELNLNRIHAAVTSVRIVGIESAARLHVRALA